MKRLLPAIVLSICIVLALGSLSKAADKTLEIYFLDMVGGGSTLIVTPLGESVLIDTGSLNPKHRDADRIYAACKDAGLEQIDHLITTHFHLDHFGGILRLSEMIPVKRFYDKGPPPKHEQDTKWFKELYPLYLKATKGNVERINAGDNITLTNIRNDGIGPIRLHCVASDKKVEGFDGDIDAPAPGFEMKKPDKSDNARSIAIVLTYGNFRFYAGGDITWNVEHHVVCPKNLIGVVDLCQITHHGLDQSNNPLLLNAIKPTVCIAMNGPRKGVQPRTFADLNALDSVEAIYQIHYNAQYGEKGNTKPEFIANAEAADKGLYIKASVNLDKSTFTVSIGEKGPAKAYPIK